MILKNFTNKEAKIYEFDKNINNWSEPNGSKSDGGMTTESVGYENRLYIQKDANGKINDDIENAFSDIESNVTPIITKLINNNTNSFFSTVEDILDDNEYHLLMSFIAMGYLRTPSNFDYLTKIISGSILEMLNMERLHNPDVPEDIKKVDPRDNLIVNVNNQVILQVAFNPDLSKKIYEILYSYKWVLVNNNTRFNFLLGDSFLNLKHPGLGESNNKCYVPLGNNKCLMGDNSVPPDMNVAFYLNKEFNSQGKKEFFIKECNLYAIINSKDYIYSSTKNEEIKNYILKKKVAKAYRVSSGIGNKTYTPQSKRKNVIQENKKK